MSQSYDVSDVLARRPRAGSRSASDVALDPHQLGLYQTNVEDSEISDHRQIFVGVHIPLRGRSDSRIERVPRSRSHHHHHRRKKSKTRRGSDSVDAAANQAINNPTAKVRFILGGQDADLDDQPHDVFTELEEYCCDENGVEEWKETARWLKFEEDVEEGGDRWSKPHVATLSLYSVFELRSCIVNGTVLLDMHARNLIQITDLILDDLVFRKQLEQDNRGKVREALLKRHKHQNERARKKTKPKASGTPSTRKTSVPSFLGGSKNGTPSQGIPGSKSVPQHLGDVDKNVEEVEEGQRAFPHLPSAVSLVTQSSGADSPNLKREGSDPSLEKYDANFMKKIPPGAEASNVLVGEVEFLKKPIIAFVRLENSMLLGDLTEVPIPTRFLFIMLGPPSSPGRYHEVGRAIATLMTDEVFGEVAYKAKCREDLLAGIDEFLMQTTVLPPCEWDPNIRIEPPAAVASQLNRLTAPRQLSCPGGGKNGGEEEHDPAGDREEQLKKTGRLCGGLISDVKRRWPWYKSDFKDALSPQCIASVIFIYFACLTPIITFGGLMGEKTDNYIGAMEQILAGCIGGILFALFSGQPLIILGATGPMLVFEEILFSFCDLAGLDYMPFRLWIGIWTMTFCIILVITDTSALVHYFTRFTEESFATLIALIYIYEGFKKLLDVQKQHPVQTGYVAHHYCFCKIDVPDVLTKQYPNGTWNNQTTTNRSLLDVPYEECVTSGGYLEGDACSDNVFFLSILLCLATFTIAISLKGFKTSSYFPTKVRAVISDFAVIISIIIMVLFDYFVGVNTPKLQIPHTFQPTAHNKRGWIIPPLGKNPWWIILAASIPALLATILVFMDQQITALIVNRREHKLKKGAGYHLDLLLVAIIIGICSILGLPWVVAATVLSVSHVQSLFLESQCRAPGEKPKFLGVRENRVTGTVIFLLIGLSVFMTPLLKLIPMPVLYGLFLYMGVSALKGLQLFERIKVIFMPIKHQPDLAYLRQVPLRRIHLFTGVQSTCLIVLWVIKSTAAALIFPVMVLMLVAVRKLMEHIFNKHELEVLDDLMPETIKKKKIDEEELRMEEARSMEELDKEGGDVDGEPKAQPNGDVPDGKNDKKQLQEIPINITDEMTKTSLWKSFVKEGTVCKEKKPRSKHRHHHHRHHKKKSKRKEDEGLWFRMDSRNKDVDTILEVEEPQTPKPAMLEDPNLISDQIPAIQVALSRSQEELNASDSGSDSDTEAVSKPLLRKSSENLNQNADVVVDIPPDEPEAEVSLLNRSRDLPEAEVSLLNGPSDDHMSSTIA